MDHVIGHPNIRQVVFTGPFGVGKTTAVRTLSDVEPISTEAVSTPLHQAGVESSKLTTTVGIDYGEWTSPRGERVALIGTPGQVRFSLMRRSALAAGAGVVLWLFGNRADEPAELGRWLSLLQAESDLERVIVVLTRLDQGHLRIEDFTAALGSWPVPIPVLTADPRVRDEVAQVVEQAAGLGVREGNGAR